MDIYFVIRFFISSLSFYIVKAWKLFIRFKKWNCRWWKILLENRFLWAYLANIFDLILSTIGEIFMDSVDFLAIVSKIWLRILKQLFLIPKVKAACILCINFIQKKHKLFATKFNSKKWSASDLPLLLDILDHKIIKEFDTMKIRDKSKESISQSQVLYY